MAISEDTVKSLVETWLRQLKVLYDDEELAGMELGGVKLGMGSFPMILEITKRKEVEVNTG